MQQLALDRLREFDECSTPEAMFTDAIDKLEPIFEMYDEHVLPAFKKLGITREIAVSGKKKAARNFPYVLRYIEAWERRAVSLDVFPS